MNEWAARECPVIHAPPLGLRPVLAAGQRSRWRKCARWTGWPSLWGREPGPRLSARARRDRGHLPRLGGQALPAAAASGAARRSTPSGSAWGPEQAPYQPGDAVDAALSLSVYDGARGPQLSGRIIDIHPAGLGPDAARQAALVDALRRGGLPLGGGPAPGDPHTGRSGRRLPRAQDPALARRRPAASVRPGWAAPARPWWR